MDIRLRGASRFPCVRLVAFTLIALLSAVTGTPAQTPDTSAADSLGAALKILTSPGGQGLSIGGGSATGDIDTQVQALAGSPQLTQEIYALAGQVLAELMKSTGGDIKQLMETLDRARNDPAAFAARLSPETLQRLSELSAKIAATKR